MIETKPIEAYLPDRITSVKKNIDYVKEQIKNYEEELKLLREELEQAENELTLLFALNDTMIDFKLDLERYEKLKNEVE